MKKVEQPPRRSGQASAIRRLVLYVEDNDDNWAVAEMRLANNYRVLRAANDREACELFRTHADNLYIVLMDIELKGSRLDGIALTKLLRAQIPSAELPDYARDVPPSNVPVIFVTAYHTTLTEELKAAGGNLVVPKPIEFMRLLRALTTMHLGAITPNKPRE